MEFFEWLQANAKKFEDARPGALKWCKRCSRKHRSQARCQLVAVTRTAKSGRKVTRYVPVERIDG